MQIIDPLEKPENFASKGGGPVDILCRAGCPLLINFEPYWIALHILSLASALFKYRTTRPSSARVASNVLIFLPLLLLTRE